MFGTRMYIILYRMVQIDKKGKAMNRLEDKIAVITGGAQGIGLATAELFAKEGASVVIANRNSSVGKDAEETLKAAGYDVNFVQTDVSQPDDVEKLMAYVDERYGRLDIAFNNAGIIGPDAAIDQLPTNDFEQIFDINVKGVFLCMKAQIPLMMKHKSGSIINTASVLGSTAVPHYSAYVASKHAVIGLTRSAALEYGAQGIRINALSPAVTNTQMARDGLMSGETVQEEQNAREAVLALHPIGRIGEPEEMAAAALWLASSESSFVIGQSLNVDGGWTVQ